MIRTAGSLVSAICVAVCAVGCGSSSDRGPATPTQPASGGGALLLVSIAHPADARRVTPKVAAVPGVVASTPLLRTRAYVGTHLEPLYAIDPASFASVTGARGFRPDQDVGGENRPALTTAAVLARLRSLPDGAFVADEHFHQFLLRPTHPLRLRVPDTTGQFHPRKFRVAGVSGSFASTTGSKIIVANLAYLQPVTGARGPDAYLVKVTGDPDAVAKRITAATSAEGGRASRAQG
jgi:hypothetical protein